MFIQFIIFSADFLANLRSIRQLFSDRSEARLVFVIPLHSFGVTLLTANIPGLDGDRGHRLVRIWHHVRFPGFRVTTNCTRSNPAAQLFLFLGTITRKGVKRAIVRPRKCRCEPFVPYPRQDWSTEPCSIGREKTSVPRACQERETSITGEKERETPLSFPQSLTVPSFDRPSCQHFSYGPFISSDLHK